MMPYLIAYTVALLLIGGAVFSLFRFIFHFSLSDSLSFGEIAILAPAITDAVKWYLKKRKQA